MVFLAHLLVREGGNKTEAVAIFGVDPSTLYRRGKGSSG